MDLFKQFLSSQYLQFLWSTGAFCSHSKSRHLHLNLLNSHCGKTHYFSNTIR